MAPGPGNDESRFSSILPETTDGLMIYLCTRGGLYTRQRVALIATKDYGRSNYGEITNGHDRGAWRDNEKR